MKQFSISLFGLEFIVAIPDGSDGYMWRIESNKGHVYYDIFSIRWHEDDLWHGLQFIFLYPVLYIRRAK
jgi:hypothetical protein